MSQQKQYIDAKLKLEDQLLKLKEEREELKDRGNKHEDKIMRENAKLQVIKTFLTTQIVSFTITLQRIEIYSIVLC